MLEAIIPGYAYRLVYVLITGLLLAYHSYTRRKDFCERRAGNRELYWAMAIALLFAVFYGLRPQTSPYMGDTVIYVRIYNRMVEGVSELWDASLTTFRDILWRLMQNSMATWHWPAVCWVALTSVLYVLMNFLGIRRIFRGKELVAVLFLVASYLFYTGGINAYRQACAYAIMFYGITLYTAKSNWKYLGMAFFAAIAAMIHASLGIMIAGTVGAMLIKRTRPALIIWAVIVVITLAFGSDFGYLVADVTGGRAYNYLEYSKEPETMAGMRTAGFRWDFLLFSLVPIGVGTYVTEIRKQTDKFYQFLLNTYILSNAIWLIFMYAYATNRFAMLSWSLYPYVMAYPLLNMKLWKPQLQSKLGIATLWFLFVVTLLF